MAIRKVIECDFCGEEVAGDYYTFKAKEFNTHVFGYELDGSWKRRFIICDECRHRIKELLIRLSDIKKRKREA